MAEKTMTLGQLYKDYASRGARQKKAAKVLNQIDWLTCNAEFDPISGMPTPMPLTKFIFRVARRDVTNDDFPHDRLWHLVDHCSEAVVRLIRNLNENPARDHEVMHIRQVKELDAPSFVKLSTRPGRNIREKLSSNPYLQAVKRYMSVDLAENRLFKAFLRRLYELLELRYEMMKAVRGDTAEAHPLMDEINRWLRSDVADEISDWENTPPNNTLLSHKDYKKVWDAWRWMLTLDEDVNRDYANGNDAEFTRRNNIMTFWDDFTVAWKRSNDIGMVECPLFFDYDNFKITTWNDNLDIGVIKERFGWLSMGDIRAAARVGCTSKAGLLQPPKKVSRAVCVDLMGLYPRFAIDDNKIRTLPLHLIWQNWSSTLKDVSFGLFGADAIWYRDDDKVCPTNTIAFADMFAGADCKVSEELQWRAAHASAAELKRIFTNETIVWLAPDGISEFDLKVIRGSLNATFRDAQPLPRSVATIYEKVDFSRLPRSEIKLKGYGVLVVDSTDVGVLATLMTARYSEELENAAPSTMGYYWERNPSVCLSDNNGVRQSVISEITRVDFKGRIHFGVKNKTKREQFTEFQLRERKDLGRYDAVVYAPVSPVVGGMKLFQLQQKAGVLPLWRDNLPLLSIEVYKDGLPSNFYLVGEKTGSVVPAANGEGVEIKIPRTFELRVNQPFYSLPLHQGAGNHKLNFAAYIKPERIIRADDILSDGNNDPDQEPVLKCKLKLTYKYGADDPYKLVFYPISKTRVKIKPMTVEWRRNSEQMQKIDLPVPGFPTPKTWDELQMYPNRNHDGTNNLLEELQIRLDPIFKDEEDFLIDRSVNYRTNVVRKYRKQGVVKRLLRDYCFVTVEGNDIYCHFSNFVEESFSPQELKEGDGVYLQVTKYTDKRTQEIRYKGEYISVRSEFPYEAIRNAVFSRIATGDARSRTLQWERSQAENPYFRAIEIALSRSMFYVYTIWNNGRSLRDADAPNGFRHFMAKAINRIAELMNDESVPERISNKALKFLCCLHLDAFNFTGSIMRDAIYSIQWDDFNRFSPCCPYVMGNLDLPEQNQLFAGVLERTGRKLPRPLMVISIVSWRSSRAIETLTAKEANQICEDLISELESDYDLLVNKVDRRRVQNRMAHGIRGRKNVTFEEAAAEERRQQCAMMAMHLELLLAMLRTRSSADLEVKKIFQLHSPYNDHFTKTVQDIGKMVLNKGYELKTRLALNVQKPAGNRLPDLLYALQLYLTGNTGANAISIVGVSGDDDDED